MHIPRENEYISVHVSIIIYIYTGILGTVHLASPLNIFSTPQGCTCLYSLYFTLFIFYLILKQLLAQKWPFTVIGQQDVFVVVVFMGQPLINSHFKKEEKWSWNSGWKHYVADGSGCQSGGRGNGDVAVHRWSRGIISGFDVSLWHKYETTCWTGTS